MQLYISPDQHDNQRTGAVTVAVQKLSGELVHLREGSISEEEFRPTRTILDVYGQRQPEQYMIRVRLPLHRTTPTSGSLRSVITVQSAHGRAMSRAGLGPLPKGGERANVAHWLHKCLFSSQQLSWSKGEGRR